MASFVVYKLDPTKKVEVQRFWGMREAGENVMAALKKCDQDPTDPDKCEPETIVGQTLFDLVVKSDDSDPAIKPTHMVTYTEPDQKEYKIEKHKGKTDRYKYKKYIDTLDDNLPNDSTKDLPQYKFVKLVFQKDKKDSNPKKDVMHITVPREGNDLDVFSYIDNVISDLKSPFSIEDKRRYYFGTIVFRRCR